MLRLRAFPDWPAVTLPFQAPRTSLNRSITAHRGFAYCSVPLSGVKAIKNAFSVTVNDVVLNISPACYVVIWPIAASYLASRSSRRYL